jgi:hypothetical protein
VTVQQITKVMMRKRVGRGTLETGIFRNRNCATRTAVSVYVTRTLRLRISRRMMFWKDVKTDSETRDKGLTVHKVSKSKTTYSKSCVSQSILL